MGEATLKLVGQYVYVVSFGPSGGMIVYANVEHAIEHAKHHTPENAIVEEYDPDVSCSIFYYAEWGEGEYVVVWQQRVHEKA